MRLYTYGAGNVLVSVGARPLASDSCVHYRDTEVSFFTTEAPKDTERVTEDDRQMRPYTYGAGNVLVSVGTVSSDSNPACDHY